MHVKQHLVKKMSDYNRITEESDSNEESEDKVEEETDERISVEDFNENEVEEESSLLTEEGSKRTSSDFWLLWPPRTSMARSGVRGHVSCQIQLSGVMFQVSCVRG